LESAAVFFSVANNLELTAEDCTAVELEVSLFAAVTELSLPVSVVTFDAELAAVAVVAIDELELDTELELDAELELTFSTADLSIDSFELSCLSIDDDTALTLVLSVVVIAVLAAVFVAAAAESEKKLMAVMLAVIAITAKTQCLPALYILYLFFLSNIRKPLIILT
jgi:hypothetical protein